MTLHNPFFGKDDVAGKEGQLSVETGGEDRAYRDVFFHMLVTV